MVLNLLWILFMAPFQSEGGGSVRLRPPNIVVSTTFGDVPPCLALRTYVGSPSFMFGKLFSLRCYVISKNGFYHLTPNTPVIHTSFTYSKLNMDEICGLKVLFIICRYITKKFIEIPCIFRPNTPLIHT